MDSSPHRIILVLEVGNVAVQGIDCSPRVTTLELLYAWNLQESAIASRKPNKGQVRGGRDRCGARSLENLELSVGEA